MADWAKIKAEYIRDGSATYRSLAKKYGVNLTRLAGVAKRENWVGLRERKRNRTETAVVDACATKEAEKAIKIYEAADLAILAITSKLSDWDELNAQDIRSLTGALKDIAAVKGIQTDAERREQEARIAKLRREAERDQDQDNNEIRVQILGVSDQELEEVLK